MVAACPPHLRRREREFAQADTDAFVDDLGAYRGLSANQLARGSRVECMIVDNYSTHKNTRVKTWLAKRPRWHLHFIPTYSSWLNQVERFCALITDEAIRDKTLARLMHEDGSVIGITDRRRSFVEKIGA
jgi:DDE superfamily endonuclease